MRFSRGKITSGLYPAYRIAATNIFHGYWTNIWLKTFLQIRYIYSSKSLKVVANSYTTVACLCHTPLQSKTCSGVWHIVAQNGVCGTAGVNVGSHKLFIDFFKS
jgi:hypothetical protein